MPVELDVLLIQIKVILLGSDEHKQNPRLDKALDELNVKYHRTGSCTDSIFTMAKIEVYFLFEYDVEIALYKYYADDNFDKLLGVCVKKY